MKDILLRNSNSCFLSKSALPLVDMVSSWRWNTLREAAWKRRARSQLSRGLWRIHPVDAAALLQGSVGWKSKHVVVVVAHSMTMVLSTSTESGFYTSWASVMYEMSRYLGIHAIWCDVQKSVDYSYSAKTWASFGICLYDVLALINIWSKP